LTPIRSRDNARVKRWAKLAADARMRREERRALIEGPHLVAEALRARLEPLALIVSETGLSHPEIGSLLEGREPVVLDDRVFAALADAQTPPGIAAEIAIPQPSADASKTTVFLEGIQDPSNVGAIVRSAAAFGAGEVIVDRDCADPWSPKALRAGMGGHFRLALRQVPDLAKTLESFGGTTVCTVAAGGANLRDMQFEGKRLGWIFGAEGRGVSPAVARRSAMKVTIPMAPWTESLNVAAAAAICLYETFRQ
jgi:TrmH family RNA methyltransferase